MRRRLPLRHAALTRLLALCTLALGVGCGDEGGQPFDFARHFEASEAIIVEERADETLLRMVGIVFTATTANLTPASLAVLDKFATVFDALPDARYTIEGHTDSAGSAASNLTLSKSRADAVRAYLVDVVGGPASAFSTVGYGETLPIASNATANGRAMNRRIEIIVEHDAGATVFLVTLSADRLDVAIDRDDATGSPSAASSDFFVQTEFYSDDDRGLVLAARAQGTRVGVAASETRDLEIVAEERFVASRDAVLRAFVDWSEDDAGCAHPFDLTEEIRLRYDDGGCWVDLDLGGDCIAPEGEIAAGTLTVDQPPSASMPGCSADLDWSLRVERIAR